LHPEGGEAQASAIRRAELKEAFHAAKEGVGLPAGIAQPV
jgi:hypothetical protein